MAHKSLEPKCIACIVGARPNFMKIAPIIEELKRRQFEPRLIHTGQHFSAEMSEVFFHDLCLPEPDENLGIGSGTQSEQTAAVLLTLEQSFLRRRPDLIVVVGDVTSTLAAALVAAKMQIPLAHVEAGLRSFDRRMPEEINRIVTDSISDFLFVTEPSGVKNLRAEGISEERIFLVGNVMIDTLLRFRERASRSAIVEKLGLLPRSYVLATLHRPTNVNDPRQLRGMLGLLMNLATRLPVVFPVHPRTRLAIEEAGLSIDGLILTEPLGYIDFLRLMTDARVVLTDSGGIQEETTILNVPCLTVRENTERPITIECGTNRLVGADPDKVLEAALAALDGVEGAKQPPQLWDGFASRRIVDVLEERLV